MSLLPFEGHRPEVDPTAWVAPGATLVGRVRLGAQASVWYGSVLRGDGEDIVVGERSNLQDLTVVHADPGLGVRLGADVTVGHRAILHNCTVGDRVLVGMGAVVLNGARIGSDVVIGAGAVVPEGAEIPPGTLVLGLPGKVRRELTEDERARIRTNAATYVQLARRHAATG
ncbi:gamma carbonic anhydrase family protein [Desertihabitans brevis]|uniref:Gamma carbonic anhydrase family protein n=1 Tax=Desertihabitans brevis TaxID=2268447 RepID=A0A367YW65_9ACTN|nr:gamma carbonic anhydrase family protein [Desertihabitans brevis]RCK69977.1 gamma carbonic anhydrase family protein [Desertihabitans brevis]